MMVENITLFPNKDSINYILPYNKQRLNNKHFEWDHTELSGREDGGWCQQPGEAGHSSGLHTVVLLAITGCFPDLINQIYTLTLTNIIFYINFNK